MSHTSAPRLWTRDFTIITIGSLISMIGNTISGFAISIMVLDRTESTLLYALFHVCMQLPMLVMPLLAGSWLDRFSRKKAIYCLDFLSAALYFSLFLAFRAGWFHYPTLLFCCFLAGSINSTYMVAYESFYPNLITPGNYSKAYSISSVMFDVSAMSYPLASILYNTIGGAPLFVVTALCFFTAACFECTIRHRETHMDTVKTGEDSPVRQFRKDFAEGLSYIRGEKGLLFITFYFMVSGFVGGLGTLHLPFFRSHAADFVAWGIAAETLYALISNCSVVGRVIGGGIHYKVKLPTEKKFLIAITVYASISLLDGAALWLPIPLMALSFFLVGLLSVTSYNIRIAATQSYIPDTIRARFNGTFHLLCSIGSIAGSLTAGSLAEIMDTRIVVMLLSAAGLVGTSAFMYRGRRHVAAIYNREV